MKKIISLILVFALSLCSVSLAAANTWTKKADMPTARYVLSSSTVDGKIYAIGGDPGASIVETYDPLTDTWIKKTDIPTGRACLATCVVDGKIYAIGGAPNANEGVAALPTMEVYDPTTDTWMKKTDMPTARTWLSTCVVDGIIYAIGGMPRKGASALSTVEAYDPATDTWVKRSDMSTARAALGTSVVDGKIYAIDGQTGISTVVHAVEAYDPVKDAWTKKSDMPTPRGGLSASVVDGKIYAIGGWNVGPLSTVEVYDPVTDTWARKANMPTARVYLSTSAVNGKIYAIGGGPAHGVRFSTVEEYDTGLIASQPDFNGDGLVDIKDLLRLIQSWGQDDPLVDIAPPPFGDGIVDALDLELFMSYWGQSVEDPTLIAHWALDEVEGAVAYDSAGVNDAFIIGGATWLPSDGQVDGALQLDGIDGCVVAEPALNPAIGPFSLFAWIKGGAPGQVVVSQQGATNWLMVNTEGHLMTDLKATGRSGGSLQSQAIITDGFWHRVGFVWDGANRILYVDDIIVAEDTQDSLEGSVGGLYIGTSKVMESGSFWSGLIDDIRIYNRAMSP